jgi:gliding motility-associated-like protein/uncharacterized repeat protein (TIGR01451 family)
MKKNLYYAIIAVFMLCFPPASGQEPCPGDARVKWMMGILESAANDSESASIKALEGAALALEKTASPDAFVAVGDLITFTIMVRNTGEVPVNEVVVEDPMTGLSGSVEVLQPGDSLVYTETYMITQGDMDFGSVVNIATVSGLDPEGEPVYAEGISHIRTSQHPGIDIRKSASPQSYLNPGDIIHYTIEIENTGNVSVHFINVFDPLIDFSEYIPALAPGEIQTFSVTYIVTEEDVDLGFVFNEVFYSGGSYYCFFRVDGSAQVTVFWGQTVGLSLAKTASAEVYSSAGEQIVYEISVQNSGDAAITDIVVEDPLTGLQETITSLNPGEIIVWTEPYSVTQADLDAGFIFNRASASGFGPGMSPVSASDEVTIPADQQPGMNVSKSAAQSSFAAAGDLITYTIVVTNAGNVTLSNILVEDPLTGLMAVVETLVPGESAPMIEVYTVTQEDLDNGVVFNVATATGVDPGNNPVSESDDAIVYGEQNPELSVVKTADPMYFVSAGDQIIYTIEVVNSGNVTLHEVYVQDPLTGLDEYIGGLAPGQSGSFSETYTITSQDVTSGSVLNTASSFGLGPNLEEVFASAEAIVELARAELSMFKQAVTEEVNAGDQLTYNIVVSNQNQVPAINVVVSDELPAGVSFVSASDGGTYNAQTNTVTWMMGNLAADASFTLNLVVQVNMDVADGTVITNFAVANNDNADFPAESNPAPVTVIARADLMILKGADVGSAYNGEQITYTLTVTNMGPSAAQNVVVSDLLPPQVSFVSASDGGVYNAEGHSVSWNVASMAAQASLTLTIVVQVKMDVAAGTAITNFASVSSDTEDPDQGNNQASVTVTGSGPRADVQVVKSVDGGVILAGNNFSYTITVTNNGPSAATNIAVVDILPAQANFVSAGQNGTYNAGARSVTWNIPSLAAGQSQSFTITLYVPSDVRGGTMMVNEVRANSDVHDPNPDNNTYIDQTPVTTPELFIPDVFSPNNDGVNDRWIIRGLDRYPNNKVVIINRWGNRVFEAAPYNNDWDGTNQFSPTLGGNELPIGTYFYILDLGNDDVRRGFIYLTR